MNSSTIVSQSLRPLHDFTHIFFDFDGTLIEVAGSKFPLYQTLVNELLEHFTAKSRHFKTAMAALKSYGEVLLAEKLPGQILPKHGHLTNWQIIIMHWQEQTGMSENEMTVLMEQFVEERMGRIKKYFRPIGPGIELIEKAKNAGKKLVLATNPLYPISSIKLRMGWAGLDPKDFILLTGLENSWGAKPQSRYYQGILDSLHLSAKNCAMIGNDPFLDLAAGKLGIQSTLVATPKVLKRIKKVKIQRYLKTIPFSGPFTYQQYKDQL